MTGFDQRTSSIPLNHLLAELMAYPLASPSAFAIPLIELTASNRSVNRLWRDAEREFVNCCPNVSLDEIVSLRDHLWFGGQVANNATGSTTKRKPLHEYLRELSQQCLASNGPTAIPLPFQGNAGESPQAAGLTNSRARQAWRWMSFALPADLVLVGLWESGKTPTSVELLSPSVRRMLNDQGFAETHLHLGAGVTFPLIWIALLRRLAQLDLNSGTFASPGAMFDEGRLWSDWLIRMAIVRYLLAQFLIWNQNQNAALGFTHYVQRILRPQLLNQFSLTDCVCIDIALNDLCNGGLGRPRPGLKDLVSIYAKWTQINALPFPIELDDIDRADPIASFMAPNQQAGLTCEMQWLQRGLDYLAQHTNTQGRLTDVPFATLFWQVVRVRTMFYRHITQRPMTPGLQWFIRFYGRLGAARKPLQLRTLIKSAAKLSGINQGLHSLEVRTTPDHSYSTMLQMVRRVTEGMAACPGADEDRFEFGMVLHLSKDRGGNFRAGQPAPNWSHTNADPAATQNPAGIRYSSYFEDKRREVLAIVSLLSQFPQILKVLRGFDVCTDELGVPTWVLKPLFRYLRDVSRAAASYLLKTTGKHVGLPRKTIHSGEDFVHLLSGLRNIWEAVENFELGDGDRIGHGVALGVDVGNWAFRATRLSMPREQRLFDLAWEWRCYTRFNVNFEPPRMSYIVDQIARLSLEMFTEALEPADVVDLVQSLNDEAVLRDIGFPNRLASTGRISPNVRRYLGDSRCFRKGHENIWVEPQREIAALESLQQSVRQHIADIGITIEINPSSNLLIGHLGDLQRHPLWRLRSPKRTKRSRDAADIRVCIGSDDPVTFATNLPDEYMLIHDAMVEAGLGNNLADEWIEQARATGMNARFTTDDWRVDNWTAAMTPEILKNVRPILT